MRKMRLFVMLMAIAAVSFTLPVVMMILGMMIIGMILMDGTMITTMVAGDGTRIIGMKVHKDHIMTIWSMRR